MIVPGKRLCDLCKNEIDVSRQFPVMSYPLDTSDMQLLAPSCASGFEMFPGIARVLKPVTYQFEFCRACVDAILPMLTELKTEYVKRIVAERDRANELP